VRSTLRSSLKRLARESALAQERYLIFEVSLVARVAGLLKLSIARWPNALEIRGS